MIYLIKFEEDGRRGDTYVKEEKTQQQIDELLSQGFVEVQETEYQLLLGNIDGNEYIRDPQTGELKPYVPPQPTDEELKERAAQEVRKERDSLLAATDFLMLRDNPKKLSEEQLKDVEAYRDALRDVPQQEGFPENVEWPEKPECIK